MALRVSSGLRDFMMNHGSFAQAFKGGILKLYSGSQPTNADTAVSGTLLASISLASGAHTNEVRSNGSVTITGGTVAGSITSITVNSVEVLGATVTWITSHDAFAALVAAQINRYQSEPNYQASSSGAVVTITAMPFTGTGPNTYVVATTAGGDVTKTDHNFDHGVAAVNGVEFGLSTLGTIVKGSGVWSGVGVSAGTAGWFRLCASEVDAGAASTTLMRVDGNIATSGANLNMSNTAVAVGATITIDTFSITLPAA